MAIDTGSLKLSGCVYLIALLMLMVTEYCPAANDLSMIQEHAVIDDRSSNTRFATQGNEWRLVTDQVMGGRSDGQLDAVRYRGRNCLRLKGTVSTANNGGFVQMALDLDGGRPFDASAYSGVVLLVAGNGESYNVHLRSSDLWLPWQSYRASFKAAGTWLEIHLPFTDFKAYRTGKKFHPGRLLRIGIVATGRDFDADVCLADLRFHQAKDDDR